MVSPNKVVAFTGGGTAGHVIPNLALVPIFREKGWNVFYVGTAGIERDLVSKEDIEFFEISAGKLRRSLSFKNFLDIFRTFAGLIQAVRILKRKKPSILFSKGGFVSVPVAIAAWFLRIPVVSHESDLTPGLANEIISHFATKIFYSFPESSKYITHKNAFYTGSPVRKELLMGSFDKGLTYCGFSSTEKISTILVMGGSSGALRINQALEKALPKIVNDFRLIHITGKGKGISFSHPRYKNFEYVNDELKDLFALSDYVVARAGSNSIFEFLALQKPMLLIPLELESRGDQVYNAKSFQEKGWANVLRETEITTEKLLNSIKQLVSDSDKIKEKQKSFALEDVAQKIFDEISQMIT